jgi:RNA polymerase sigma-70 factor, ECF subfamily
MTDAELIIASRRDPRAFRALYERWAEPLLPYFYRRVLDAEVAADLLAETFAVAFERRGRYRDTGQPGAAWLYGIAAKELSHWFRRQEVEKRAIRRLGVAVPPLDDESIARIEALVDLEAHRGARCAALEQMSAGERDAVELRVVGELGYVRLGRSLCRAAGRLGHALLHAGRAPGRGAPPRGAYWPGARLPRGPAAGGR